MCRLIGNTETVSISSNRLISLVKVTAGSQPLLSKLLFEHFSSGEHTASVYHILAFILSVCITALGITVWLLFVHALPPNIY